MSEVSEPRAADAASGALALMAQDRPNLRVVEAGAWDRGGPVEVELRGPAHLLETLSASLPAGVVRTDRRDGLLGLHGTPADLRLALATAAPALTDHLDARLASWGQPPSDLMTPAGTLPTASRPVILGILNVTPDSFSDGGANYRPGAHPASALAAAERMLIEGADAIDVGGESTRPGAEPVTAEEELARVVPVIRELAGAGAVVSVDTSKAVVARAAIEAGAAMVNDVSAGGLDPALIDTVAAAEVPYVLMHMQGTPRTMQHDPTYLDVVADVHHALDAGLELMVERGIARERLVVDPGIGFGKRLEHNLALLRELMTLTSLGRPVLVGASRKRFIGDLTGADDPGDRLEGSLAVAALAVAGGARLLRVHDVAATVRAVTVAHAVTTRIDGPHDGRH